MGEISNSGQSVIRTPMYALAKNRRFCPAAPMKKAPTTVLDSLHHCWGLNWHKTTAKNIQWCHMLGTLADDLSCPVQPPSLVRIRHFSPFALFTATRTVTDGTDAERLRGGRAVVVNKTAKTETLDKITHCLSVLNTDAYSFDSHPQTPFFESSDSSNQRVIRRAPVPVRLVRVPTRRLAHHHCHILRDKTKTWFVASSLLDKLLGYLSSNLPNQPAEKNRDYCTTHSGWERTSRSRFLNYVRSSRQVAFGHSTRGCRQNVCRRSCSQSTSKNATTSRLRKADRGEFGSVCKREDSHNVRGCLRMPVTSRPSP